MNSLLQIVEIEHLFSDEMMPHVQTGDEFIAAHPDETTDEGDQDETQEDLSGFDGATIGPFQYFSPIEDPLPLAAVDAGLMLLGNTPTASAFAVTAAAVYEDSAKHRDLYTIGPKIQLIDPQNAVKLMHYMGQKLGKWSMWVKKNGQHFELKTAFDSQSVRDRFRSFVERKLQLDMIQILQGGILLIDGSLSKVMFDTPLEFLQELSRRARYSNSDIVAISKKSKLRVRNVHISSLLNDRPFEAGFRRIYRLDTASGSQDAAELVHGVPFAVRFSPSAPTLRVDVSRCSSLASEESVLNALYANAEVKYKGYPELLVDAHIYCDFSAADVIMLRTQAVCEYGLRFEQEPNLSGLFAPVNKRA